MHVVLTSIGTDGDIFPFVGLGIVLRDRGHAVTLAASEHYASLAEKNGMAFRALVSTEENKQLFEHPDFWKPLKTGQLSARWGVRFLARQYELLRSLATPGTVLVTNPGVLAAPLVHETCGTPIANLILQPWLVPSSIAPPLIPWFTALARAPRPVWDIFRFGLIVFGDVLIASDLNRLRTSLGMKPTRRVLDNWLSKQLIIAMFPDWFGQPQADWPKQIRMTGFPMFDGVQDQSLPAEVLSFCRSGPPPVAFTFGTGMAHPARLFREALEACSMLGCRGILLTKYRDQLPDQLPPSILHCNFAPFQKLFPHCAAIVHHGGIGTVAKALAAGVPQLIYPQCFDQIDNGMRVKKLGAGDCLRTINPDGRKVADALGSLMTDQIRARCQSLTPRLQEIDVCGRAAELLEKLAANPGITPS